MNDLRAHYLECLSFVREKDAKLAEEQLKADDPSEIIGKRDKLDEFSVWVFNTYKKTDWHYVTVINRAEAVLKEIGEWH